MSEPATLPPLAEVMRWIGADVAEIGGSNVGKALGLFVDSASGDPVWLIVGLKRRRGTRVVAVPLGICAGAAFGVWVAHEPEKLATAPVVDPRRPLRREHELTICGHFEIGEQVGRAAEVAGRPEGDVTAVPPGG